METKNFEQNPYVLGDFEEKRFSSFEEVEDYLAYREKTDKWSECYINEIKALGVPADSPILAQGYAQQYPGVTEEQIIETMDLSRGCLGLLLNYPKDKTATNEAIRYTAVSSLFNRAEIGGKSFFRTSETQYFKPMSSEERASVLSSNLFRHTAPCKVLSRDGKVSFVGSDKYQILPGKDLWNSLKNTLLINCEDVIYRSSYATHEETVIDVEIKDEIATQRVTDLLEEVGIKPQSLTIGFRFLTSDVGAAAAQVYPFIVVDGEEMPLADPIQMTHTPGNTLEKWTAEVLPDVVLMIDAMVEKMQSLRDIEINNPGGCLRNIACELKLPKEASIEVGAEFDEMFDTTTAFNVYYKLNAIISRAEEKNSKEYTSAQKLKFKTTIMRALNSDFRRKDIPFEWKEPRKADI